MQVSAIIPILNEEETLQLILDKLLDQKIVSEIIVVNDGSKDRTKHILNKISSSIKQKNVKFIILEHKKNLGKGAAIRTALKKVSGNFIIIQDADLEYNPAEYKKLLKNSFKNTVVYGSRILRKNPHAYTRTYLGNVLITALCNLLFGSKLTDIYTCYKVIPADIAKSLKLKSNGFEIEAEITAKLLRRKINIVEKPISYNPRGYKDGKKIRAKDAFFGALTLLKIKTNFPS